MLTHNKTMRNQNITMQVCETTDNVKFVSFVGVPVDIARDVK